MASSVQKPGISPRDGNRRSKEELELLREMDKYLPGVGTSEIPQPAVIGKTYLNDSMSPFQKESK